MVTLTATVQAGAAALTVGQVNFCDATAASCTDIHLVGTVQLTSAGTAVLRFRPGPGSHSYKALFLGTLAGAASSSAAVGLTVGRRRRDCHGVAAVLWVPHSATENDHAAQSAADRDLDQRSDWVRRDESRSSTGQSRHHAGRLYRHSHGF